MAQGALRGVLPFGSVAIPREKHRLRVDLARDQILGVQGFSPGIRSIKVASNYLALEDRPQELPRGEWVGQAQPGQFDVVEPASGAAEPFRSVIEFRVYVSAKIIGEPGATMSLRRLRVPMSSIGLE